ncbi:MAG: HPr(Ser) kinase/phosphatase [Eubacteriales bacterium]
MKKYITVEQFASDLDLTIICPGKKPKIEVSTSDMNRPGLQLAGFFEYFGRERVQLFGNAETTFLKYMDKDTRKERLDYYFSHDVPCVIVSRGRFPLDEMVELAEKYGTPVLSSSLSTTRISHKATVYLDKLLAPYLSRHGELMDVYGVGMLITGDSGVGKSETALELVKRGHRLVSDDVVEIIKISDDELLGRAPEITQYLMEIRGVGIIDVSSLYGLGAVMAEKNIDLCVTLEPNVSNSMDRLGIEQEYITILGVSIPMMTIPVKSGRNLAVILEVAAMNFRFRDMGHTTLGDLNKKLISNMNNKTDD